MIKKLIKAYEKWGLLVNSQKCGIYVLEWSEGKWKATNESELARYINI